MDPFLILFLVGFIGLAVMAFSGFGHHHAGGGHHLGHVSAARGGHGAHVHHAGGHGHGHAAAGGMRSALLAWLSPRVLFAASLGAGAAGLLARPLFGSALAGLFAVGGAVLFELTLARPLFRFADRFVSRPALSIASALYDEAEAVTGFNAAGEGMVRLTLDGQVRQLLAVLAPDERAAGVKVRAGERVRVEEVDAVKNRCVVSRRAIEG